MHNPSKLPPARAALPLTAAELAAMTDTPAPMQPHERAALDRLIAIAQGDTGQARRVADFLLSWWNAQSCGAFDPTSAWGLDLPIAQDVATVFGLIVRSNKYPDGHDPAYEPVFRALVRAWRPDNAGVQPLNAAREI